MSFWELLEKPSSQEMARLQDKGGSGGPFCTMHCTVDAPINSISTCKDGTQVVVAGRNVFKIMAIEETGFSERANLRVGRVNLNFSICDTQWHPVEDHLLATAAGNGAIVIWNLNKITKQKQEQVFTDHKRTVNRIQFHPVESNLLLSGSQDGTMKCFDIRKPQSSVVHTMYGKSESIRDVQFNPFDGKLIAAACENGNVQLWDMRRPDNYYHQFMAHNGPVFAIDWHLDERTWVATGGRDTLVKVWDVQAKATLCNTIQTIASVARVKWRPQSKFHIASCALLVDFDIHVWDIRRPYIPNASFSEHKDVVTGIHWPQNLRGKDPNVFLSCAKDNMLYQHVFADAHHPADHAPPVGLSINVQGDMSYAFYDQLTSNNYLAQATRPRGGNQGTPHSKGLAFLHKFQDIGDNFNNVSSSLVLFQSKETTSQRKQFFTLPTKFNHHVTRPCELRMTVKVAELNSICSRLLGTMDIFQVLARSYQLSGKPFVDLCDHNCNTANNLSQRQHARTWCILKTLYSGSGGTGTDGPVLVPSTKSGSVGSVGGLSTTITNPETPTAGTGAVTSQTANQAIAEQTTSQELEPAVFADENDDSSSSSSGDDNQKILNVSNGLGNTDFLYGDEQDEGQFFFEDTVPQDDAPQDWTLPSEAFQPRVFVDRPSSPAPDQEERPESPTSNVESESTSAVVSRSLLESTAENSDSEALSQVMVLQKWDFTCMVVEMLHHFAKEGDIQMCVSALIVLGDKIRHKIDEQTQEQWLMSYIDLLGRLQMWTVATQIIKLSSLPVVSSQNQASTSVRTACGNCRKQLTASGWFCGRCSQLVQPCSLCHLTVKGPHAWCQGCGHGGHVMHMQEWFAKSVWCPAGCGHMCEFT